MFVCSAKPDPRHAQPASRRLERHGEPGAVEAVRIAGIVLAGAAVRRAAEPLAAEIELEARVERHLLVVRLREHQAQRVLDHAAVAEPDRLQRAHRIESLGDRDANPGAARGRQKAEQRLLHARSP